MRFCPSCGQLAGPPPLRHSFSPQAAAEAIFASPAAVEGERKRITVLFADIKDSMRLLAAVDPEDARKIIDPVLERMIEAVHRYEGTVNQIMGDGIMALFGAPLAHEDHAVRACYAALRMQDSVRRHAADLRNAGGPGVEIRVGLNSGDVVVRAIGSDLHMDYTAVGQAAHMAARMEQIAEPGSIFATEEVMRLAEGFVRATPRGRIALKGLAAPVDVYVVVGVEPVRRRLQVAAARGMTRFVGRDTELAQLRLAQEWVERGRGQVVGIVGEPGVGKSRLFHEFVAPDRMRGWLVLQTGGASYEKSTAYMPVVDLLRSYFDIHDRDDDPEARAKVVGKVTALGPDLTPALSPLLTLLHLPVADAAWEALDPRQRRQQTMDALWRLLSKESQAQPVCLVFEDLQWIDSETQAFLDSVVNRLPTTRVLLLVNYRPEYRHGWGNKSCYTQLRIDPLSRADAEELLRALAGDHADLEPLTQLLIERTEGNPFFLEETVRALAETGALTGQRGAYRLAKLLDVIEIPASVQAVLAARVDRLPQREKLLLETASIVGKEVPYPLLAAIADMPEDELRRCLADLQAAEFLFESSAFPDVGYTFKHALTHEVASRSVLQQRRRALHRRIVQALEGLYPDRLSAHLERLAHHALGGELWEKAVTYSRLAGVKASARSANREAVALFRQALEALAHLPESRDKLEQSIDVRFALRTALTPLGDHATTATYLSEAEPLAEALGDPHRLGRLSAYMSDHLRLMGQHDRAVEFGQRALAIANTVGDHRLRALANTYLGLADYARGDYRRAAGFLRANVEVPTAEFDREHLETAWLPAVHSRAWLAVCLAELGDFAGGTLVAEEAVSLARSADHAPSLCVAYFGVGQLALRRGDLERAIAALEDGLRWSRQHFWLALPNIAAALGSAYALAGRITDALPLLAEGVQQSTSMHRAGLHSIRVVSVAEGYLLAGRPETAVKLVHESLQLARDHGERGCEAWALRLLGEIGLSDGQADAARVEEAFQQASRLAQELGMRPLVAQADLGLARLYRRTGDHAAARQRLAAAADGFRAMDMPWWLGRAQAELERVATSS